MTIGNGNRLCQYWLPFLVGNFQQALIEYRFHDRGQYLNLCDEEPRKKCGIRYSLQDSHLLGHC